MPWSGILSSLSTLIKGVPSGDDGMLNRLTYLWFCAETQWQQVFFKIDTHEVIGHLENMDYRTFAKSHLHMIIMVQ